MSERMEQYKAYRLRVKACQACNEVTDPKTGETPQDVIHDGKTKSVPGYFHPEKVDVLLVFYQPEEVDHKRQQVTLYTGEKGKVILAAMDKAGIKGNPRIGFTSLIKCKLTRGNVKRRVCKRCAASFFEWELDFLDPRIVVLVGEETIKAVLPELFTAGPHINTWTLEGRPFLALDRWYLFCRDPADALSGKVFKPGDHPGETLLIADALQKAVNL